MQKKVYDLGGDATEDFQFEEDFFLGDVIVYELKSSAFRPSEKLKTEIIDLERTDSAERDKRMAEQDLRHKREQLARLKEELGEE